MKLMKLEFQGPSHGSRPSTRKRSLGSVFPWSYVFVKSTEGRPLNHGGRGPLSLYIPAPPPSALFSLGDTRLQAFGVEPRWVASGMRLSSVESMCEVCSL